MKKKKLMFLLQALDTKVSRVLAAVASGGSLFHSVTVLERKENCTAHGIVIIRVAGR